MNRLQRALERRRTRKEQPPGGVVPRKPSAVADVVWERSEELRPDHLGPAPDDIRKTDETSWRPARTLGQTPKV